VLTIDVETAAGVRRGAGPLASASSWRRTRRLDRAGGIAFDVAATDARASLVGLRSYAHAFGDARLDLGRGIVEAIELDSAARVLSVAGDDLLRELAMRPIGFVQFTSGTGPQPLTSALDTILSVFNSQTDPQWTIDYTTFRSTGTTTSGSTTVAAVTHLDNWRGREGTPIYAAGIPAGATVTAVGATSLTLSVAASASASGVALSRYQVFYKAGDESILGILSKMADLTGTHFRLGQGRQIVWLYNTAQPSGVRAVTDVAPHAAQSNPDICLITDLQYLQDSSALISHVTPWGSGNGDARLRLATSAADANKTTRTAPPGYTLDLDNNVIRRDAAQTDYGYWNVYRSFNDITVGLDEGDAGYAAALVASRNMLFDAAFEYLRSHSYVHETYRLSVAKLDRELLPGQTLRVVYRGAMTPATGTSEGSGRRWIDIDRDLLILEATTATDGSGITTPSLVVSTIPRWPSNDVELLIDLLQNVQQSQAHRQ
jgi:hypothetical protein